MRKENFLNVFEFFFLSQQSELIYIQEPYKNNQCQRIYQWMNLRYHYYRRFIDPSYIPCIYRLLEKTNIKEALALLKHSYFQHLLTYPTFLLKKNIIERFIQKKHISKSYPEVSRNLPNITLKTIRRIPNTSTSETVILRKSTLYFITAIIILSNMENNIPLSDNITQNNLFKSLRKSTLDFVTVNIIPSNMENELLILLSHNPKIFHSNPIKTQPLVKTQFFSPSWFFRHQLVTFTN